MKFKIDNKIFENYPDFTDGICVARNIDNTGHAEEIIALMRKFESEIREVLKGYSSITDHPKIAALREVHKKFGNNPKKFPPSIEAMYRAIRGDKETRAFSDLVNIYNLLSIKYGLTAGGEDLDKCEGDIVLTYADGTEKFCPIGSAEHDPPLQGEVVYKDEGAVICRRFNWRQSDARKLEESTRNAVIVFEGFTPEGREDALKAAMEARELAKRHCGGEGEVFILDKNNNEVEI